MMKPGAKAAEINSAAAEQPKGGHRKPAAAGKAPSSNAGNMSSADMGGAFSSAVAELKSQHPHAHYDHGPHHGTTAHQRHKPYKMS